MVEVEGLATFLPSRSSLLSSFASAAMALLALRPACRPVRRGASRNRQGREVRGGEGRGRETTREDAACQTIHRDEQRREGSLLAATHGVAQR